MPSEPIDRRSVLRCASALGATGFAASVAGCTTATDETESPEPTTEPESTEPESTEPGGTESPTETGEPVVRVDSHPEYGEVLVDPDGMTLYMFAPDEPGESVCYDDCAEAWPPLTVESEDDVVAGDGVTGEVGVTERDDGTLQVTVEEMPVYYWVRDEEPGDATGMGVNNVWFLLRPDGTVLRPTVSVAEHDQLGAVMTDADGMTLYMLTADSPGESVCYDDCAEAWPPLTVESEDDLHRAATLDGGVSLGVTERDDGSLQVTANEMPLYYWVRDEEPGDATGQEVNNVWFVLRPDASVVKPTVSVREHSDLGEIVTDADGMTLYMFENDEGGESSCYGDCADAWPPLTVGSEDALVDSVRASVTLGTTERDDGDLQVTAADLPLYYFVNDEEPGDATGQGANDVWFVLDPEGSVVREDPSES